MAISIEKASSHVIHLLKKMDIELSEADTTRFQKSGIIERDGKVYWLANVRNPYSKFGVKVNIIWFSTNVEGQVIPQCRVTIIPHLYC